MNIITATTTSANAITHGGIFHADEVFATVLLGKVLPEVRLCRTFKVPAELPSDVIVYDIGGGRFDHHQKERNGARENGIFFSSFGLLWKEFGMQLLEKEAVENKEQVFQLFDRDFVSGIDAVDNGQVENSDGKVRIMSLSNVISAFNPTWDDATSSDEAFLAAVEVAEKIFERALKGAISKVKAQSGVESAIEQAQNQIMVLNRFLPWQEYLLTSQNEKAEGILYVVFPSNRGGYNVQAVPEALGSFKNRKPLPSAWAGLNGQVLAEASGVASATFCHPNCFICGANTLDDAMEMAKKAVEA